MKKTILFFHQSAELYGSDKTLLCLVKSLKENSDYIPIVILPNEGELTTILKKLNIQYIITPVLKLSRGMFRFKELIKLPFQIFKSIKHINTQIKGKELALIHSNTLAVLLGAIYARLYKIKHIWHVHEIIEHPKSVKFIYSKLVNSLSCKVIFNSKASLESMCGNNFKLNHKSVVVWNGIHRNSQNSDTNKIKKDYGITQKDIVIGLVGRISRWKGHELMLDAFCDILKEHSNIFLVFVGSPPPNQAFYKEKIEHKIRDYGLKDKCLIVPFQNDIWGLYDTFDFTVVPSTEPEPFGMVALEAMISKRAIIAANHGGLKEIIVHDRTGLLFEPNSKADLKLCLRLLITNKEKRSEMALEGYERALIHFSEIKYVSNIMNVYDNL